MCILSSVFIAATCGTNYESMFIKKKKITFRHVKICTPVQIFVCNLFTYVDKNVYIVACFYLFTTCFYRWLINLQRRKFNFRCEITLVYISLFLCRSVFACNTSRNGMFYTIIIRLKIVKCIHTWH